MSPSLPPPLEIPVWPLYYSVIHANCIVTDNHAILGITVNQVVYEIEFVELVPRPDTYSISKSVV